MLKRGDITFIFILFLITLGCYQRKCDSLCQIFHLMRKEWPENLLTEFRQTSIDTILFHELENDSKFDSIFSASANKIISTAGGKEKLEQYLQEQGISSQSLQLKFAVIKAFHSTLNNQSFSIKKNEEEMIQFVNKYYDQKEKDSLSKTKEKSQ